MRRAAPRFAVRARAHAPRAVVAVAPPLRAELRRAALSQLHGHAVYDARAARSAAVARGEPAPAHGDVPRRHRRGRGRRGRRWRGCARAPRARMRARPRTRASCRRSPTCAGSRPAAARRRRRAVRRGLATRPTRLRAGSSGARCARPTLPCDAAAAAAARRADARAARGARARSSAACTCLCAHGKRPSSRSTPTAWRPPAPAPPPPASPPTAAAAAPNSPAKAAADGGEDALAEARFALPAISVLPRAASSRARRRWAADARERDERRRERRRGRHRRGSRRRGRRGGRRGSGATAALRRARRPRSRRRSRPSRGDG